MSIYQVKPDFFLTREECLQENKKKYNTNKRYKFFFQTHFTCGDCNQFETHRDKTNGIVEKQDVNLDKNIFNFYNVENIWSKYKHLDAVSVDNTFNYMFHKFKKGIFVKIKNGEFHRFLPFSKKNYNNEWSQFISIDPKYQTFNNFIKYIHNMENRKFFPHTINKFSDCWYGNNCFMRYEFPIHEGDTNNPAICDMFKTLCQERKIPDIEFFVNRRDFPLLKKNGTEPYNHMFGNNVKLLSHNYDKYCPILSMVEHSDFSDIAIPTGEDWARVSRKEGKFFPKSANREYDIKHSIEWKNKKPIAVFRGSSTGEGVNIDTNARLKIAYLSKKNKKDSDGLPFLNAGITEWNLRPRKLNYEKYLKTIDINTIGFDLINKLTPQEQSEYKYVINIDGHVSAFRLSLELEFKSCILIVDSDYSLWYKKFLKPFVHYIPIKKDLSDLYEKIKWCKNNDNKCEEIANNAYIFSQKYLTKEGILDYLQKILYDIKIHTGIYKYLDIPILDIIEQDQLDIIKNRNIEKYSNIIKKTEMRSYGFLKSMEHVEIKLENKQQIFSNDNTTIYKFYFEEIPIIEKITSKKTTNEIFTSFFCTNKLSKFIPNFCYTFSYTNNSILMEFISNETLYNFLKSEKNFNMRDLVLILFQIGLCLHMAQEKYGFVHNDLAPWNIMIKRYKSPIQIQYIIDYTTVYTITTNIVPVIIDMASSHIIYEGKHYGSVNIFSSDRFKDIFTLLSISLYELCSNKSATNFTNDIILLANYLSFFKKDSFKYSGKDGLGDIRFFFNKHKKYSEIMLTETKSLKQTPKDFIKYFVSNFGFLENYFSVGNCFDYLFNCDNYMSFLKENHQISKIKIPKYQYNFQRYYFAQNVYDDVKKINGGKILKLKEIEIPNISYDENIFLFPEKVLNLYKKNGNIYYGDILIILEEILVSSKFPLPESLKKVYIEHYKNMLLNKFNYLSYEADINTLISIGIKLKLI
jgi:hypothetical protein